MKKNQKERESFACGMDEMIWLFCQFNISTVLWSG